MTKPGEIAPRSTIQGLENTALIPCLRCQRPQMVLWSNNTKQFCDDCFGKLNIDNPLAFQLLFAPESLPDGTWRSNPAVEFAALRKFVEKCMRPTTAGDFRDLIVTSQRGIADLINLLEERIILPEHVPAFAAQQEELKSVKKLIEPLTEQLRVCHGAMRELELKMSKEKSEVLPALAKQRNSIKAEAAVIQARMAPLTKRRKDLISGMNDFRNAHPSVVQKRALERLRREYALWQKGELDFHFLAPVKRVYWELLKPAGDSWREIVRYFEYLQSTRGERYELARVKQIHGLRPDEIYTGTAEFEGYVVFLFKNKGIAVLDCPKVGNALYAMAATKWKFLSQLSKTELLNHHQNEVQRIIHGWGWFGELEKLLGCHDKLNF